MQQLHFTLKQHTPIIHFQHTQDGATLRATEVKPKLDRFIIEQCVYSKTDYNKWLIGKGKHESLDYKIIIKSSQNEDISQRLRFESFVDKNTGRIKTSVARNSSLPMILANMVAKSDKEELKDTRSFETLECSIYSFKPELLEKVTDVLPRFFALHNFGNRQNKGFGSFTVININGKDIYWDERLLPTCTIYLHIKSSNRNDVFNSVDYFYKWLKSGINYSYDRDNNVCHPNRYKKAVLFEYLESIYPTTISNRENWEKRWLKEKYLSLSPIAPSKYSPKYYRALMGLSDKHTFTKAQCNIDPEFVSNFQFNLEGKLELQNIQKQKDIERIKSPYTFKIVTITPNLTNVYLLINQEHVDAIYTKGLNKELVFFKKNTFELSYRIGANIQNLKFNFPKDDLSVLDSHLNILRPHIGIPALKDKYRMIENFKAQFNTIELPSASIDYNKLLQFFKAKYPTFIAKDFKWRNILDNEIEILSTQK